MRSARARIASVCSTAWASFAEIAGSASSAYAKHGGGRGADNRAAGSRLARAVQIERALEAGYADVEKRLADGRPFLVGDAFSVADIIWSLTVLRIRECGYPFDRFPALSRWYARIEQRPGFRNGVMARHRTLSRVLRLKAALENLFGVGLRAASSKR
jgi:glutathione S-transferase